MWMTGFGQNILLFTASRLVQRQRDRERETEKGREREKERCR